MEFFYRSQRECSVKNFVLLANITAIRLTYNSVALIREPNIPTKPPPLVGEDGAYILRGRESHVVSVTDLYGSILGFLDRSIYFSIK
jgi:hypothetical protein